MAYNISIAIVYLFELLISYIFFNQVSEMKKNKKLALLFGILCFGIAAVLNIAFSTIWLNFFTFFLANSIFSVFCFELKLKQAIFHSIVLDIVSTATEYITIFVVSVISGEDVAYTTYFHATKASGTAGWRYNRNGVISVFTAKTFDDPSNTNYVIECDYYADKANRIQLIYAGESSNVDVFFDKDYDESEGPAWKTFSMEFDNFYAHRVDTGLGANEGLGGSASDGGFRFQSVSGSDVIIKTIRVYTPGAVALKEALNNKAVTLNLFFIFITPDVLFII